VKEPASAIDELSKLVGFSLRGYVPGTVVPSVKHDLPRERLHRYIVDHLKLVGSSKSDQMIVRKFSHGQSNPTYYIRIDENEFVLRKKPV
jgi:aminoglycoside phosphotransferase (APT) family kinase protein